ncbi:MAG: 2-dehydro-3-deoxygalactonokinase [Pseudomonadota bacterium]|nr:2-dehydro-3-deoxygalactonokinase [Pseudomonadota bacterium]
MNSALAKPLATALIAIDWGTSSARAYRLDARGRILDERSAPLGVQKVEPGKFPEALSALLGADVPESVPMIACGMIGSRQGWIEAPYRDCPADFDGIAAALTPVPGMRLSIVPGLLCRDADGVPDVMRGEETQIMGALDDESWAQAAPRVVVLPGTHSKWALVEGKVIEAFATFMTGELYAVLREHSILGRLAAAGSGDGAALERGVLVSLNDAAALPHDLFSARTLALTGALAPEAVADYLSGLLLGAEVAAGRCWLERHAVTGGSVILVGEAALCERYRRALALAGMEAAIGPPDAAARGLWRIARRSGMVA